MGTWGIAYAKNTDFWSIQRAKIGYPLQDLASKVGVRQPALNNWFAGKNVPRDRVYIYRLCKCLEVDYFEGLTKFNLVPAVLADTIAQHNTALTDIEELLDISSNTLSAYIRKKCCPKFSVVSKIADLFNIDADNFYESIKSDVSANKKLSNSKGDADLVTESLTANPEKLLISPQNNAVMMHKGNLTNIKEVFNAFYDFVDFDTLMILLNCVKTYSFRWDLILDYLYESKEFSRQSYDIIVTMFKDLGIYA